MLLNTFIKKSVLDHISLLQDKIHLSHYQLIIYSSFFQPISLIWASNSPMFLQRATYRDTERPNSPTTEKAPACPIRQTLWSKRFVHKYVFQQFGTIYNSMSLFIYFFSILSLLTVTVLVVVLYCGSNRTKLLKI